MLKRVNLEEIKKEKSTVEISFYTIYYNKNNILYFLFILFFLITVSLVEFNLSELYQLN